MPGRPGSAACLLSGKQSPEGLPAACARGNHAQVAFDVADLGVATCELPLGLPDVSLGRDLHQWDQQRDERGEHEDQIDNDAGVIHQRCDGGEGGR